MLDSTEDFAKDIAIDIAKPVINTTSQVTEGVIGTWGEEMSTDSRPPPAKTMGKISDMTARPPASRRKSRPATAA